MRGETREGEYRRGRIEKGEQMGEGEYVRGRGKNNCLEQSHLVE